MGFVDFLYGWQELVGAFVGAFIAVILSFIVTLYYNSKKEKKERQAHYSNLLLVLYDLQRFISKCEEYIKQSEKGKKLFDKVFLNDKLIHVGASHVFYMEIDFYKNAQYIYGQANVIKSMIDSGAYNQSVGLMRYYLPAFYRKFNIAAREVRKLKSYYGHLKFPKDISFYEKDYVEGKIEELKLEKYS